ncbi:hypothetical protein D0864_03477 [Hortaea werneckii]|uniref:NADH dehydrogenase [ubiquinone] 1 alpha subcomplex subunit 1 n=1 Tax=Hortaea werneckii TaxID=91943 RepID=A0A3M7GKD0_HORWE|nr:hypothetical protein D0864_03477 [Hortaea werneckii]
MGVPFEALIPYAICLGMFGVSGAALSKIRHMQNGGKRGRHSVDQWDRQSTFPSALGKSVQTVEGGREGRDGEWWDLVLGRKRAGEQA